MANQVIDGTLDIEVPGSATPIESVTIDVQTFGTGPNSQASYFIVARDIGAAPPNGLTQFIVRGDGNVGLGTANPSTRLDVRGTAVIEAPAAGAPFNVLRVNAGSFGTVPNMIASYFIIASDIGSAPPNGEVRFSVRGDGLLYTRGGVQFPDGTVQVTAQIQGPPGPAGVSPPPQVVLTQNTAGGGFIALLGPGNRQTIQLTGLQGAPNNGVISVTDAAGAAAGVAKARMFVDTSGFGTIEASVKNFRVPNPSQAGTEIVYACIEGPEAAVYVRGTGKLVDGQCTVSLPDHFVNVSIQEGMTVQVTPLSADSLGLAVVDKGHDSVVIKELHEGAGNYSFDWEVKSIRRGYEDYQVIRPHSEASLQSLMA